MQLISQGTQFVVDQEERRGHGAWIRPLDAPEMHSGVGMQFSFNMQKFLLMQAINFPLFLFHFQISKIYFNVNSNILKRAPKGGSKNCHTLDSIKSESGVSVVRTIFVSVDGQCPDYGHKYGLVQCFLFHNNFPTVHEVAFQQQTHKKMAPPPRLKGFISSSSSREKKPTQLIKLIGHLTDLQKCRSRAGPRSKNQMQNDPEQSMRLIYPASFSNINLLRS